MLKHARNFFHALFTPLAKGLLAIGVTPNAVTVIGTVGVSLGALVGYPLGQLFWATVVITLFVFSDLVDGLMAQLGDKRSEIGRQRHGDGRGCRIAEAAECRCQ